MYLSKIEKTVEGIFTHKIILLSIITAAAFLLRIVFLNQTLPPQAPDTITFLIESLALSNGEYKFLSPRFMWPGLLSVLFSFVNYENYLDYVILMKITSVVISVSSIPILYIISRNYLDAKYSFLVIIAVGFHPELIQNSLIGITEPLFILLGLLSFYFLQQKKSLHFIVAFFLAGLCFDTRWNGIVLVLLAILAVTIGIKEKKKIPMYVILGLGIFVAISFPHFAGIIEGQSTITQAIDIATTDAEKQQISPHLIGVADRFEKSFSLDKNFFNGVEGIYFLSGVKEVYHLLIINLPYLWILVPFGILVTLKRFEYKHKILIAAIIISLIIALPQYTQSAVLRNLFFILPFLGILFGLGFERSIQKFDYRNIILMSSIIIIITSTSIILYVHYDTDSILLEEKEKFANYVVENYEGKIFGDSFMEMYRALVNVNSENFEKFSNEKLEIVQRYYVIEDYSTLLEFIKNENIQYIIADSDNDYRLPALTKIYNNSSNYKELEEVFDSTKENYQKYKVKIFKVNR